VKTAEFGPEIREVAKAEFAKVTRINGVLVGEVLHVDGFGNIITNINQREVAQNRVKGEVNLELAGNKLKLKFCRAYGETKPQEPLTLIGSHGFLEISINQGNAAKKFKTKTGDKIKLLLQGRQRI
jgi:S-adenosylmethionine hydrolase